MKNVRDLGILTCLLGIVLAASIQVHREVPQVSSVVVLLLLVACVLTQRMGGGGIRSAFAAVGLSLCVLASCRLLVSTHFAISDDRILYFRPAVFLLATTCLLALLRSFSERDPLKPDLWVRTVLFTTLTVLVVTLAAFSVLSLHYSLESSLLIQVVLNSTAILASVAIATAGFSEPRYTRRFDGVVFLGLAGMLVASLTGGHLP